MQDELEPSVAGTPPHRRVCGLLFWLSTLRNVTPWLVDRSRALLAFWRLDRNFKLYLIAFGVLGLTSPFVGPGVLINLMINLHAPSWMAVLPSIAATSIAYLPVVLMGWLLRPGTPKKRVYAVMCTSFYALFMVMGAALCLGGSEAFLRVVLLLSLLASALCVGLLVLPFWDLFYRSFPPSRRGRVTGVQGGMANLVALFAAPLAAWMISTKAPLPFPINYGVGLVFAFVGGVVSVVLLVAMKDVTGQGDGAAEPRRSFRTFVGDLAGILRHDRGYRRFLLAAAVAGMLSSVGALMLVYAKQMRGLSNNHFALMVLISPYIGIPSALFFGWLIDRIGAKKVCVIASLLMVVGIVLAPFFWGIWQLVPMTIAGFGGVYGYVLLAILNHAPAGKNQDYLSVYYLTAMIPGLAPVVLGWLVDTRPVLVLAILAALALVSAILFMKSSSSAWQKKPAPSQTADQPGAAEPAGAPAGHLSGAADAASKSD